MRHKLQLNPTSDNCPCKGCADRYVGCHSECLKYIDWKQDHTIRLQKIHEEREIDDLLKRNSERRNQKLKQGGGYRVNHHDSR